MPITADTCKTKESVPVYVNILPKLPTSSVPVVSACVSGVPTASPQATQASKSNCQCQPSTSNGTCVNASNQHVKYSS